MRFQFPTTLLAHVAGSLALLTPSFLFAATTIDSNSSPISVPTVRAEDYRSLQQALDVACNSRQPGAVLLPKGVVQLPSGVTMTNHCELFGQGPGITTLRATASLDFLLQLNGYNIKVRNLTLDGAYQTKDAILWRAGINGNIENVEIEHTYANAPTNSFGDGITLADWLPGSLGTSGSTFRHIYIHDVGRNCIWVGRGNDDIVEDLTCRNAGQGGIDAEPDGDWEASDWKVLNSHFYGNPDGSTQGAIYVTAGAGTTADTKNWEVSGNYVEHVGRCSPGVWCEQGQIGAIVMGGDNPTLRNNTVVNSPGSAYAIWGKNALVDGNVAENSGQMGLDNRGFVVNGSNGTYSHNLCVDSQSTPTQGWCFGDNGSKFDYNTFSDNSVNTVITPYNNYLTGPNDRWLASGYNDPSTGFGGSAK